MIVGFRSSTEYLWKIAVVLEPGQQISDITEETEVIAIITPNRSTLSSAQNNYPLPNGLTKNIPAGQWNKWEQWRVSVDYLEQITNYDFLSHVPGAIQEIIEQQGDTSGSLLATTNLEDYSSINSFAISPDDFLIGTKPQIDTFKDSTTKVSFIKRRVSKDSISKISILKVGTEKSAKAHVSPIQDSPFQVDPIQKNIFQISTSQIDSSKVSFSSSITSDQFSSFHNHDSTPQIIDRLNNSATNIWSDLLQTDTELDIDFQITDLPKGQLAEATMTGFDDSGKPNAGKIFIDHDANGVGWFIDSTPLDNSEFSVVGDKADREDRGETYLLAAADSEAEGKYDLLTTVLHELAHLYGFIDGYAGFDANVETENGITKFIGDDFEAILDGEHLDKSAHPHDLLNTHLAPGMRKLPSEIDVEILQAILADEKIPLNPPSKGGLDASLADKELENINSTEQLFPPYEGGLGGIEFPTASLTSDPLLAIANGNFNISDTTTDSFAWDTRGASGVENGQAVLTEDSPFLSNFTQTFTIPEEAKTLQFKLVETELRDGETGD